MKAFRTIFIPFTRDGISGVSNVYPIVYRILTAKHGFLYIGIARRGRAQQRLCEHLGEFPGARLVEIGYYHSILDAKLSEINLIRRYKPNYNIQHNC